MYKGKKKHCSASKVHEETHFMLTFVLNAENAKHIGTQMHIHMHTHTNVHFIHTNFLKSFRNTQGERRKWQMDHCELRTSLLYIASSRSSRATQ